MRLSPVCFAALVGVFSTALPRLSLGEAPPRAEICTIREMDAAEADRAHPATIRGVITYHDPTRYLSFIQDETAGIYVSLWYAKVRPGDVVEVSGKTAAGDVGRIIVTDPASRAGIRLLGHGALPTPKPVALEDLRDATFDAQWVSTQARVESVTLDGDRAAVELVSGDARLRAFIPGYTSLEGLPRHLIGFPVEARGVLGTALAPGTGAVRTTLDVPSIREIRIDPAAFAERFESCPVTHFEGLFSRDSLPRREPTRVQGRVTLAREGHGFFLNLYAGDHVHGTVFVQSAQPGAPALGDWVDTVGVVERANGYRVLQDAIFRVLSHGPAVDGLHIPDRNILKEDFHGHLIVTQGQIVETFRGLSEAAWLVRTGFGFVQVMLPRGNDRAPVRVLEPGTRVGITGILLRNPPMAGRFGEQGVGYQIQLRTSGDLTVLKAAPWWTVRRIGIALGLAALVSAAALGWVYLLRKRVREQMETIRSQLERAAVSEERTRIARELHDSLAQHLASITIQLDAVAVRLKTEEGDTQQLLETAREMAAHSMDQTRLAIWDLRSPTLARDGLVAAIHEVVQPLTERRGTLLRVTLEGEVRRLGGGAENHLLRIVQEASANALQHGSPTQIEIAVLFRAQGLMVTIHDNGAGFRVPSPGALPVAHFGLRGMFERAKKIGGQLVLESEPGAGTTISVWIPWRQTVEATAKPLPSPEAQCA
ncbi:histidine kinase [Chthoniobacter flavus]|uniref:histidine kinase n=1 Tax=Chthoniobacter flavus TaxID=191863 RepID=UPI00105219F0|nr:histidine kinase [Chthoniobacter flavus]